MSNTESNNKPEKVQGTKAIKMTNKDFINKFFPSFSDLSALPSNGSTGALRYSIKRSLKSIQTAFENYEEKRKDIFESRAKLDDYGNPQFDEHKNYILKDKESRKGAFKDLDKLNDKEITLTIYPIRKENMLKAIKNLTIGMEMNLGEYIIPSEEDLKMEQEFEKEGIV